MAYIKFRFSAAYQIISDFQTQRMGYYYLAKYRFSASNYRVEDVNHKKLNQTSN